MQEQIRLFLYQDEYLTIGEKLTSTFTDQRYYFYFNINEHYHNVTHSHLSLWECIS